MEMDTWITDAAQLTNITADRDIHGEWWEIPADELRTCSLGISYLDAAGVEFYLPAYLTAALTHGTYPDYRAALTLLDPNLVDDYELFRESLASVKGRRWDACVKFLKFAAHQLQTDDPLNAPGKVQRILEHKFWSAPPAA